MSVEVHLHNGTVEGYEDGEGYRFTADYNSGIDLLVVSRHSATGSEAVRTYYGREYSHFKPN